MLEIITIPVGDIKPNDNNLKEHTPEQVAAIAASIREFGMNDPIAVDETNIVIEGQGRLLALQQLGAGDAPCIRLSHLSDIQKRAYIIAHNQLTLKTGFDTEKLIAELNLLKAFGFDITLAGFDYDELSALFSDDADALREDEFDVDQELQNPPFTQSGDVWTLRAHKLVCGDSTKPEAYALLMCDEHADLLLTDPPYNVDYQGGGYAKRDGIKNDRMNGDAFNEFLTAVFSNAYNHSRAGVGAYVFHSSIETVNFVTAFQNAGFRFYQQLIWVKNQLVLGRADYQQRHEPIMYGWKNADGARRYFTDDRTQSTVYDDERPNLTKLSKQELVRYIKTNMNDDFSTVQYEDKPLVSKEHPTMKPIRLVGRLIINSSKLGQVVLDPFGGSGSTLIACEQSGRICRTIELDEKYCDVIVKRYIESVGDSGGVFVERSGAKLAYSEVVT